MIWKLMERNKNYISDELLAAFLDGNVNMDEADMVVGQVYDDPQLKELMAISDRVDAAMEAYGQDRPYIPMAEGAAVRMHSECLSRRAHLLRKPVRTDGSRIREPLCMLLENCLRRTVFRSADSMNLRRKNSRLH